MLACRIRSGQFGSVVRWLLDRQWKHFTSSVQFRNCSSSGKWIRAHRSHRCRPLQFVALWLNLWQFEQNCTFRMNGLTLQVVPKTLIFSGRYFVRNVTLTLLLGCLAPSTYRDNRNTLITGAGLSMSPRISSSVISVGMPASTPEMHTRCRGTYALYPACFKLSSSTIALAAVM